MKKTRVQKYPINRITDRAAGWVGTRLNWLQAKWADSLDRFVNKRSPRERKLVMASVLILMLGYNLFIVVRSFGGGSNNFHRPVAIRSPVKLNQETVMFPPAKMPEAAGRVIRFGDFLDSLSKTIVGQKIRDSLLRGRPGLRDSVDYIRKIYRGK